MNCSVPATRAILLVGFMGAGKSSVGRALARKLGWKFEDLDDRVERREGRSVGAIFRDSGEAEFRRAEHGALQELLDEARTGEGSVLALGGGAFVEERNAELIVAKGVSTVFLDADVMELWRRCRQQAEGEGMERPMLGDLEQFQHLYRRRLPHYRKARLRQETSGMAVEEIAEELARELRLT
jgi:shikimate kinase